MKMIRMAPRGYFPGEYHTGSEPGQKFVATGEFRAPRKGEYFLSGAIVEAYLAKMDFRSNPVTGSGLFWIARPATKREVALARIEALMQEHGITKNDILDNVSGRW